MTYRYFVSLDDALKAIERERAKQCAKNEFYNITLRKTKMTLFCYFIAYAITILSVISAAFVVFKAGEKELIFKYGQEDKNNDFKRTL